MRAGKNLDLRLSQYIHCAGSVVLGDNCRLYCWDASHGKPFDREPEIRIGERVHVTRNLTCNVPQKSSLKMTHCLLLTLS